MLFKVRLNIPRTRIVSVLLLVKCYDKKMVRLPYNLNNIHLFKPEVTDQQKKADIEFWLGPALLGPHPSALRQSVGCGENVSTPRSETSTTPPPPLKAWCFQFAQLVYSLHIFLGKISWARAWSWSEQELKSICSVPGVRTHTYGELWNKEVGWE